MSIFIVFYFSLNVLYFGECTQVKTKQGILEGQVESSRGGRAFYAFYGIPYAKPPIGDLRFEDPVPPKPWQGIRDASVLPPQCPPADGHGEEDCLYLNVYTPKLTKDALMPVMMFIYGGAYLYGHALPNRYGPHYFMDKDVILITFHYRLGALGFISTEDEVLPGNYGLKDSIAVLKWIQNNIASFGGDKNRVTVIGGSSGGVMTNSLLISPLAKGLFHRCISQSGFFTEVPEPGVLRRHAWKFATIVGCGNDSFITTAELKSCLKTIPAERLAEATLELFTYREMHPKPVFGPVLENEKVPGAYLVDQPLKLLQRNTDIPWLLGMNSDEGGMVAIFTYFNLDPNSNLADEIAENYQKHFPELFDYGRQIKDPQRLQEVTESIKKNYFKDNIRTNALGFSKIYTVLMSQSLRKVIDLYKGPKYVYYYNHRNNESFAKTYGNPTEDMGVIHGDELISMFNWSEAITPVTEGIDLEVSQRIINLWTNFAAFGDPNGNEKKLWKPVKSASIEHLYIKDGLFEMRKGILEDDNEFFKSIS